MSCIDCDSTNIIRYAGNGTHCPFTFAFQYQKQEDIVVRIYNYSNATWEETTEWTFENPTTIKFNTAPPAPQDTDESENNIEISRCTDVEELNAEFFPGSAIRAQDLNTNFEQLQFAIQETPVSTTRLGGNLGRR